MEHSEQSVHSKSSWQSTARFSILPVVQIFLAVAVLSTLAVSLTLPQNTAHHYGYLASAMARGSFSVNNLPTPYADKVLVGHDVYIPLGPMPGLLLVPLTAGFGLGFDELWFANLFTALNILFAYLILKKLKIPSPMHRLLLVLFFCGTIYLSALVIGRSWFLAHILTVFFLLAAIYEVLSHRRPLLIGIWLGMAFLTRGSAIFALPFFVWMLKPEDASWRKPKWLFRLGKQLVLGLAIPFLFYFYHNYTRFGNPLETGYAQAVLWAPILAEARQYGLFSLAHVPKNLYALLLAGPQPYPSVSAPVLSFPYIYASPWGMGIFYTTPVFGYIFTVSWRERIVRAAWLAIGLMLLPLVTYYGIGWVQFGYRYALDFYPFLFILTALGVASHFNRFSRALILVCVAINVWGAWWQMIG